jgi:murein DD-endopeptidase MepM/ murein hydrolase activator NlpD
MLVPHENDQVRSFQLTPRLLKGAISAVLLVAVVSATFTVGFFAKQGQEVETRRLRTENQLLAAEIDQMRDQVSQLSVSIDEFSAKDEQFRVIAGLPSIDSEVRRVGIGGPGTPSPEDGPLHDLNQDVGEKVFAASYDLATLQRRASLLRSSISEALTTLERNTDRLAATPSIAPSAGHLTSLFSRNRRHPVLRITRPHEGIDIAAPMGEAIMAPARGTVRFAGWRSGGYGNTVEIDHGYGYVTRFAHASRVVVRAGQTVERGQKIAEVGATGLVTGPHLHYEVEVNGRAVDPLNYIIPDAVPDR